MKFNVYDTEGYIIGAELSRYETAELIGCSHGTIDEKVFGMVKGQKVTINGFQVEYPLKLQTPIPDNAKKLLLAEWDKVCKPFRDLRRKKDADDK